MHLRHEAKFGAYVLACAGLHDILGELWQTARQSDNSHLDVPQLVESFELRVREFFRTHTSADPANAALDLAAVVSQIGGLARRTSLDAGRIWDRYASDLQAKSSSWSFEEHIERLHSYARDLARSFFAGCSALEARAIKECRCDIICEEASRSSPPMTYADSTKLIEAVFAFDSTEPHFRWYLALPFRFIHEYTAHIFAIDTRCQVFSDGWMLVAASRFVQDAWLVDGSKCGLSEDQVYVFQNTIQTTLPTVPQRGMRLAGQFQSFLDLHDGRQLFFDITHILCSLEHLAPLDRLRFTQRFLRALEDRIVTLDGKREILRLLESGPANFVAAIHDLGTL